MERTTSQELTPQPSAEGAFILDAVDNMRTYQYEILANPDLSDEEKTLALDQSVHTYLDQFGITPDRDDYDAYYGTLRNFSVDTIDRLKWEYGTFDPATQAVSGKTGRDHVNDAQVRLFGGRFDLRQPGEDGATHEYTQQDWAEHDSDTAELLKKYGELVGERSKNMRESTKTRAEIDTAKEAATDLVNATATQMMIDMEAAGKTEEEIAQAIDEFVNSQMDMIMEAMESHRQNEYEKSSPAMKYVYDTWAKWTAEGTKENGKDKLMSKGKIKKLAATALPAAGIAAGVAAFAPAVVTVGTVGAVAAGVGLVAKSIGRNLAGGFLDRKAKARKLASEQREQVKAEYERAISESEVEQRKTIFEVADEYSQYYRRKNLRRTITGVAVAGTFGLAGATVGGLVTDKLETADFGKVAERVKDFFGKFGAEAPRIDIPDVIENDTGSSVDDLPDRDGDGVADGIDAAPNDADIRTELPEISRAARFVTPNEGGFQTLKELGVPEAKWETIWADAGEILHDQDKTYMMEDGHWGWSDDMRLSDNDLRVLIKAANRHGVQI